MAAWGGGARLRVRGESLPGNEIPHLEPFDPAAARVNRQPPDPNRPFYNGGCEKKVPGENARGPALHTAPLPVRRRRLPRSRSGGRAFTVIELLAVIAIMAIIAALVGPTLKNLRKGDATASATRQLLDATARARQLAISQHETVYMVFLPTNFWGFDLNGFLNRLTYEQRVAVSNLVDEQLTGYTFISLHTVGDQPGQSTPHYLSRWQTLPDGSFIPPWKFTDRVTVQNPSTGQTFVVMPFTNDVAFPFPSAQVEYNRSPYLPLHVYLPYIAFNYQGQLIDSSGQLMDRDEFIPLARGALIFAKDANQVPIMDSPQVLESPPGDSTNDFNLIHIDRLTGRARLEHPQVQ